jgi:hypothetical protein
VKPHQRKSLTRAPGKKAFRAQRLSTFFRSRQAKLTRSPQVAVEAATQPRHTERQP